MANSQNPRLTPHTFAPVTFRLSSLDSHPGPQRRAVANSMINVVDWWHGWRGPQNWRWGNLSAEHEAAWETQNRSFEALACIEWMILMDAMDEAKKSAGEGQFLEIRYEDLCADAASVLRTAVEFSHLEWSRAFENLVSAQSLRNTNDRWKKDLTSHQQKVVEDVLHDHLVRYGYS